MAVTINKTDGTVLTTIQDGQLDATSTNLSLIGRSYRNYGELVNENFVKLLENFANSSGPNIPIVGQLWYNTSTGYLNLYRSTGFIGLAVLTSASAQPSFAKPGDFWFDTVDSQLKFYNGSVWTVVSPPYTSNQTKTGLFVETIQDSSNNNHVCIVHYQQNTITGIECRDQAWVPKNAIPGITTVNPGYTLTTALNQKFYPKANDSDSLGGLLANKYVRNDVDGTIDGSLTLANDGLTVGENEDIIINTDGINGFISIGTGDLYFLSGLTQVFAVRDSFQTAFANGTEDEPSITNLNDPSTGIYFPAANEIAIVADSTKIVEVSSTGVVITGDLETNTLTATTANVETLNGDSITANSLVVKNDTTLGSSATDDITFKARNLSLPNNLIVSDGYVQFDDAVKINDVITTPDGSEVTIENGVYIDGDSTIQGDTLLIGNLTVTSAGIITINTTAGPSYSKNGDVNLGRQNGLRSYNSPKAWISFNGTAAGLAIYDSFNIGLVARTSFGNYTLTLEYPFTSAAIAVIGSYGTKLVAYPTLGATTFKITTDAETAYMSLAVFYR